MYGFNDDRSKVNAEDVLATNWKNGSQTGSVRTIGSKEEDSNYTIGQYAVAEGYNTKANGDYSHAEGSNTITSGSNSHAEGSNTITSGSNSHAEGLATEASGHYSHAEGQYTEASGRASHTEGYETIASGWYSHAEGENTLAIGGRAHAEGCYTIASGKYSHVQGKYNIEDPSAYTKTTDTSIDSNKTYYTLSNGKFFEVSSPTTSGLSDYYEYTPANANLAYIIGNGASDSSRSNALTVDWDGNLDIAGNLQIGDNAWINKVVDIDSTVAPSSDKWKTAIHIKDKNDLSLGYLEGAILSNGYNGLTLTARRNISGTNKYNGVRLLIDSSGTPVVQFNDTNAWRTGLGLGGLATKSTVSPVTLGKTSSAKYTGSLSGAHTFSVTVSCAADSGYKPIAITGIYPGSTSGASEVFLRGFNMNGYNAGPTAFTVETYWRTTSSANIAANTFTAYVEFMTIKTTLS